jgi:hypothetical protein
VKLKVILTIAIITSLVGSAFAATSGNFDNAIYMVLLAIFNLLLREFSEKD